MGMGGFFIPALVHIEDNHQAGVTPAHTPPVPLAIETGKEQAL